MAQGRGPAVQDPCGSGIVVRQQVLGAQAGGKTGFGEVGGKGGAGTFGFHAALAAADAGPPIRHHGQVTELSGGAAPAQKAAVVKDRPADARADGQKDGMRQAACCTGARLAQQGHVGVIVDDNGQVCRGGQVGGKGQAGQVHISA